MPLDIVEIFNSLSGEVGEIPQGAFTTFIRLAGCNLDCSYCDTDSTKKAEQEIKDINPLSKVLVTGGEPLLQRALLKDLITYLYCKQGVETIQIETNGSIDIPEGSIWNILNQHICWVVDYKLPGSGMRKEMRSIDYYVDMLKSTDWLKFVVSHCDIDVEEDINCTIDTICSIIDYSKKKSIGPPKFAVGMTNTISLPLIMKKIREADLQDWVTINIQLHKFLNLP